ncbi:MOSC domain-containing protein [Reinekea blandensis]|uniref:MOSC domain-containing protein n=1 Tax=Reinekea blandensis MED297 TaxID=314283 RepID=A4BDX9_9GAMM|nr:hypothetical protein [Reinekea blandensis]EAR09738.1 hypothetical protein MED297_16304 [Reinekea blandensis MED297]
MTQVSQTELQEKLAYFGQSPTDVGVIKQIVRRPAVDQRETITEGVLTLEEGLVGDSWRARGNRKTPDGSALLDAQLTLMNARVIEVIAGHQDQWPLAGDQFFVDFDLSEERLPAGTVLKIGDALIEVTAEPHLGCRKFSDRFGKDATLFVNSTPGKALRARGVNAKVIRGGEVRVNDSISVYSEG